MYKIIIALLLLTASSVVAQLEDYEFKCYLESEGGLNKSSLNKTMITGNYNITYVLCVENGQSTYFSAQYIENILQIDNYFSTVSYGDITIDNVEVLVDTEYADGSVEAFELSGQLSSSGSAPIFCVPEAMVVEVLDNADLIYNFNDYDYDNDGTVDMLIFMVARYELYDASGKRKGSTGAPGLPGSLVYTTNDARPLPASGNVIIDGSGYRSTSGDNAMVQRARATNPDDITGISVHELGHGWFDFPDVDHIGSVHNDTWAFGGFDEMTDGRGFGHRASLYNPAFRLASDWGSSNLTEITSTETISLSDYDETGDIYFYDIPDHAGTSVGGQRIYLTAYTKPSSVRWQDNWPVPGPQGGEKGLMIWRENRNLNLYSTNAFNNALYPPVDIEVAHGKWQWDNINLSAPPPADKRPINTNIADPLLGRDSLEAYYSYYYLAFDGYDGGGNPTYVGEAVYDDWRVGSESCFFSPFSSTKEYAFYTNPNSCAQRDVGWARSVTSGFKLENITVNNDDISVDVKIGSAANIIKQDVTLAVGEWHFYDNVTVASGVTLTIQEGTELYFSNSAELKVYGNLVVNGTSSNNVVLDFVSKSSSNGIKVYSGGTADIEYAEIKNAGFGLYAIYADIEIFNAKINNCTYGIYLTSGADAYIKGCTIVDNSYGIYAFSSCDLKITGNRIGQMYHPNGTGIKTLASCSTNLYGNVISYNTSYGIWTYYSDITRLGFPYNWSGKNTIMENGSHELYAATGNPDVDLLQSSLHDDSGYEIYNYTGNQYVIAQSSWFGGSLSKYGSVNNWGELSSAQSWEGSTQLDDQSVPKKNLNSDVPDKYRGFDGILALKAKINNLEGGDEGVTKNLKDLFSVLRNDYKKNSFIERELFYELLDKKAKDKELRKSQKLASKYQIYWKTLEKDYNEAIKLASNFLKNDPDEDYFEVSISLANLYLLTNKKNQAEKILNELSGKVNQEEELIVGHLRVQLSDDYVVPVLDEFIEKGSESNEIEENEIITEYALNGNYPNPFNPSTTIKYSVPEVSNVSLTIYDMMGKEIRTFEYNGLTTGQHSTIWDGTNNNGVRVSSGVYIYKFRAVSLSGNGKVFEKASKLMLVK